MKSSGLVSVLDVVDPFVHAHVESRSSRHRVLWILHYALCALTVGMWYVFTRAHPRILKHLLSSAADSGDMAWVEIRRSSAVAGGSVLLSSGLVSKEPDGGVVYRGLPVVKHRPATLNSLQPCVTYADILLDSLFTRYNVFQATCVVLWWAQSAWLYAAVITAVVVVFAAMDCAEKVGELRQWLRDERSFASQRVHAGGPRRARDLRVGDTVLLQENTRAAADMRLVADAVVLVDESLLTGESHCVRKTLRTPQIHAGTAIVSASGAYAVVTAVGSETTRGRMMQQVLFGKHICQETVDPLPQVSALIRASCAVCIMLFAAFVAGYWWGAFPWMLVLRGTDMFAVIFEMFSVMALGISFAARRLQSSAVEVLAKGGGSCAHADKRGASSAVAVHRRGAMLTAGAVTMVCFDKTGTLTTDTQTLVAYVDRGTDGGSEGGSENSSEGGSESGSESDGLDRIDMLAVMACCHSTLHADDVLRGDPLEVAAFVHCGAVRTDTLFTLPDGRAFGVSHTDPFDPASRLQSVTLADGRVLFKGAGESLRALLAEDDSGFDALHAALIAKAGPQSRVLAAAVRRGRGAATLVGMMAFANPLRPEAPAVIRTLAPSVALRMCTGDAPLAALLVAIQCGLVPDCGRAMVSARSGVLSWRPLHTGNGTEAIFVITGDCLDLVDDATLASSCIFARCTPQQKSMLMERLRAADPAAIIAFCGDGENDCGALMRAHVGISISSGRAATAATANSIAASFSVRGSLAGVPLILREGSAAISTVLALLRLFILTTASQIGAMLLLGVVLGRAVLSNLQVVWIDAACVSIMETTLARIPIYSSRKPRTGLLETNAVRRSAAHRIGVAYLVAQLAWIVATLACLYCVYPATVDNEPVFVMCAWQVLSIGFFINAWSGGSGPYRWLLMLAIAALAAGTAGIGVRWLALAWGRIVPLAVVYSTGGLLLEMLLHK